MAAAKGVALATACRPRRGEPSGGALLGELPRARSARAALRRPGRLGWAHDARACAPHAAPRGPRVRRSTTRQVRRSTRWRGCSGSGSPVGRRSTRCRGTATRTRSGSHARMEDSGDSTSRCQGLKTAVLRHVKPSRRRAGTSIVPDVAASFQEAIVDVQVSKTIAAARRRGVADRPARWRGRRQHAPARAPHGRRRRGRDPRASLPSPAVHRQRGDDRVPRRGPMARAGNAPRSTSPPTRS